jgi:hypothetical protein
VDRVINADGVLLQTNTSAALEATVSTIIEFGLPNPYVSYFVRESGSNPLVTRMLRPTSEQEEPVSRIVGEPRVRITNTTDF